MFGSGDGKSSCPGEHLTHLVSIDTGTKCDNKVGHVGHALSPSGLVIEFSRLQEFR